MNINIYTGYMKQKNPFFCLMVTILVAVFGITLISCGDDDAPAPILEVSPENLQLDDSGEGTLTITSNTKWEVSTTADWLTFSTMSGVGDGQVTVRANGNSTLQRTTVVTINADNVSRQVRVFQGAIQTCYADGVTFNVGGIVFNMVHVEGGTFYMGATNEQGNDVTYTEEPVHTVTLNNYYIGETEVTQGLWQTVMGQSSTTDSWSWNGNISLGANLPAYGVSWYDCQEFVERLSKLTNCNFGMPTEAEWEYAARGGIKSKGYKYAGSNNIDDVAWYKSNSGLMPHDIAQKKPNELGLFDMCGNVLERCSDWMGNYNSNAQNNPTGSPNGSHRVSRGGGFNHEATKCRVSSRLGIYPETHDEDVGFRLVLH